jgi:hypothetical protein
MELLERADAYMNMGDLDQNQQRITPDSEIGDIKPEDYGYTEEMSRTNKELGALMSMVAHGILGWSTGQKGLDLVMQSESLSDSTKQYIKDMVDQMSQESSGSDDHSDSSNIESDHTYLQEEVKKKIRANFKRFML